MDVNRLLEILAETTCQYRKGEAIQTTNQPRLKVIEMYDMPHASEADAYYELVDLHFIKVGVDKIKAECRRAELVHLLKDYPDPNELASGPSYIAVGARLGDQGAAFCLFALGKVLGLWGIITPETLGIEGDQARDLVGRGYIMCSGWRPEEKGD